MDEVRKELLEFLPRLRRFALGLTGSQDSADDLVQETCLRALSRIDQFEKGTRLDSWLYRIAQNVWIDERKSARARTPHTDLDTAADVADTLGQNAIEARITMLEVSKAISQLPDDLKVLVLVVCVDGSSYQEAAEICSIPVGTVMSRLARARRMLHGALNMPHNEKGNG